MRGPWGSLAFLLPAAGLLLLRITGSLRGRIFPLLLCSLASLELISFSFGYTGFTASADVFPAAPVFEFLRSRGNPSTFRIAKAGYPIPANSGILYGLESADGYEIPNQRARLFSTGLIEERDDAVFYEAKRVVESTDRRLDMLNVKYWITIAGSPQFREFAALPERFEQIYREGSIAVFENKFALPRLFAVPQSGVEIMPDPAQQLAQIRSPQFDPEKTVYIATKPAALDPAQSRNAPFHSDVRWIRSDMNSLEFRSRTSGPSVLVLSQIYYPGWKAAVDGKEVLVDPVDCALMGIPAPEGEHTITFYFEPRSFRTGGILSLVSILLTSVLIIRAAVWKKVRNRPGSADGPSYSRS
jgi:hypothetical protein